MRDPRLIKLYVSYFKALDRLQARVLIYYVAKDFLAKNFYYERKIYKARLALFLIMKKIRFVVQKNPVSDLSTLENLYEIIFSLNTLKLRVADLSVFEIFQAEVKQVSQSISAVLQKMTSFIEKQEHQNKKISLENITDSKERVLIDDMAKTIGQFSRNIEACEEVYRGALQVVAPEPIFFLFFLQGLIALREKLEAFFLGFLQHERSL